MAFALAARPATISEMNITPLVDVMLVLLIIFMVAAPMLSQPLTLDLPIPDRKSPPPPPMREVSLQIAADGALTWNGSPLSLTAVDALLQIEAAQEEAPLLAISVAPQADYAHVAAVLGKAKAAGLQKIALPQE